MSEGRTPLQALRQGSLSSAHATLPANEQMWAQDGATGKRVISPKALGSLSTTFPFSVVLKSHYHF